MTLTELTLRNMKRNMRSYGLYIGATVFSILIYFTFVTLQYSKEISELSEESQRMQSLMSASAFVLIVFVAIFVLYSNAFFVKKRKKEVALYALMGVRKRAIGWMLFFENIVIGIASLVAGIGLGFLVSQALLAVLLKLMGLELTVGFIFSQKAVMHTAIVFLLLFVATSLQAYRVIYRFRLIELFHAEKAGEALPRASFVSALAGMATLTCGYWLALQDLTSSEAWRMLSVATPLVIIGLTIFGTFLIFRSVLVYMLHRLKRLPSLAWRGLRLLSMSQMLYRVKGNARTLTIIATLSATTITAGGAVFGLYYNAEQEVKTFAPYSFMWQGEAVALDSSIVEFEAEVFGKSLRIQQGGQQWEITAIPYEYFAGPAQRLGWRELAPPDEGSVLLIDALYDKRFSVLPESIAWEDVDYPVSRLYEQPLFNVKTIGARVMVMTSRDYEAIDAQELRYQMVDVKDYKSHLELSRTLGEQTEQFSSAVEMYRTSIGGLGAMLFVGSFLGLVFLVATGSMIFFKTLTEAEEDRATYAVLSKLGISRREMRRSIRQQVGMMFAAPLMLGLLHGGVALLAFSNILQTDLWIPVLLWMLAYSIIYLLYYIATARSFERSVLPIDKS
ncbi:ABC transporter permease [Paenibacillus sp. 598K]|uniref:FtsX-like permease family protein n=1 Tax=Paenibacillus sp. 598K TaxID=1117987 RepID=UPI000FF93676|nr:ABC transporter permease [Paenibacillus sp. 598K]GBF74934.1 ABC transporter permease [Paenibacillus sp. 598K]